MPILAEGLQERVCQTNLTSDVGLLCFRFSATVLGNIWVIKPSAFLFSLFRALAFTLTLAENTCRFI